jgi:hypothetical protein
MADSRRANYLLTFFQSKPKYLATGAGKLSKFFNETILVLTAEADCFNF